MDKTNLTTTDLIDIFNEVGTVVSINYPYVTVEGLPGVTPSELVLFENGILGVVELIHSTKVEVIIFSKGVVYIGEKAGRTGQKIHLDLESISGNLIHSGQSVTIKKGNSFNLQESIDSVAPTIHERSHINDPLYTGVSLIDLMIPLGKGQRQLLLGDRKTGKSALAMQIIRMQAKYNTKGVYSMIGKKKNDILSAVEFVKKNNLSDQVFIITSEATDPLSQIYVTPYISMKFAELLRDRGDEALLVLDDLTTHAKYYREMSLMLGKFPGRESYPGDIFYTHSRLIERAGKFKNGTITCLPLVDTVEGDISGYIQTNLMSMTDGHIYFNTDLFFAGQRPAIDASISVTRVGRQAQSKLRWAVNRELTSFFTLYKRTENFVHFGAELSEGARSTLNMGQRILRFFKQSPDVTLDINIQIFVFLVMWTGLWNPVSLDDISEKIDGLVNKYYTDEEFRNKVDTMTNHEKDLNFMLGEFNKNMKTFDPYLK